MTKQTKRVKVNINEKEYTIISDKPSAHIDLVAQTINRQLKELSELSNNLSQEEQAMLIAVNAVSDQIEDHKKMIQLEKELDELKNSKKK